MSSPGIYETLIRTLTPRDDLSPEDVALIRSLPFRQTQYPRGMEIITQDSEVSESCLVIKGWAGRAVYLENGKRQITALHIAGDFVDLHILGLSSVHMNRMIQELRQSGFITWQGPKVVLKEPAKLEKFAGFDGRYLNFMKRRR
jgi:CRP-like cAMP-binding protein